MESSKLIKEGNAVYEIDMECMLTKTCSCDNISNRNKCDDIIVADKDESRE